MDMMPTLSQKKKNISRSFNRGTDRHRNGSK